MNLNSNVQQQGFSKGQSQQINSQQIHGNGNWDNAKDM
jgi:hypothetical protein